MGKFRKILIVGPPGAGKGTQAEKIVKKFNIPHISTGDIFRLALKEQTKLGLLAKKYMDKGDLVPDKVTVAIVKERLMQKDCKNGFLLDGFPRNIEQAKDLDEMLKALKMKIDCVLNIKVNDEVIIQRINGRRVCPSCGATYNIDNYKPKVSGICDVCQDKLIFRKDDKEATVRNRLRIYANETYPIIAHYKNIMYNIKGINEPDVVFEDIKKILGE